MKKNVNRFNVQKVLIFTLIVIIGFIMTACPTEEDNNSNDTPANTFLGHTLTLSGMVYLEDYYAEGDYYDDDYYAEVIYSPFTSNLGIIHTYGGSGQITNGNLNYTIGIPSPLQTLNFEEKLKFGLYEDFICSRNVRGVIFSHLSPNSNNYPYLYREFDTFNKRNNTYIWTYESVMYVYVDNDVTVTAKGRSGTEPLLDGTFTYINSDINLAFKAGWNTIYYIEEESETISGTSQNPRYDEAEIITLKIGNPSHLKWVLH